MKKTEVILSINSLQRDIKQQIRALENDSTCSMWDCTDLDNWDAILEKINMIKEYVKTGGDK